MSATVDITFKLNGVERHVTVSAPMSALEMLRDRIGLTGTKYACGEGECGACTISVDGLTVNSCLMFAVDCDGRDLVTIEGLVSARLASPSERASPKTVPCSAASARQDSWCRRATCSSNTRTRIALRSSVELREIFAVARATRRSSTLSPTLKSTRHRRRAWMRS